MCRAAYLVIGADILFRAVRNILHGKIFDENFLMSVATVGAFAIGEYPEAVAVIDVYKSQGRGCGLPSIRRKRRSSVSGAGRSC